MTTEQALNLFIFIVFLFFLAVYIGSWVMIKQAKPKKSQIVQEALDKQFPRDRRAERIFYYGWGSYGVLGYLLFFAAWLWPESMRWAQAAIDWFMPWIGSLKGAARVNRHPLAAQVVLLYSWLMLGPLLLLTLWLFFGSRLRCQRVWYRWQIAPIGTMSWPKLLGYFFCFILMALGDYYVAFHNDNPTSWRTAMVLAANPVTAIWILLGFPIAIIICFMIVIVFLFLLPSIFLKPPSKGAP